MDFGWILCGLFLELFCDLKKITRNPPEIHPEIHTEIHPEIHPKSTPKSTPTPSTRHLPMCSPLAVYIPPTPRPIMHTTNVFFSRQSTLVFSRRTTRHQRLQPSKPCEGSALQDVLQFRHDAWLDICIEVMLRIGVALISTAQPDVEEVLTSMRVAFGQIIGNTGSIQRHIEASTLAHVVIGCPLLCDTAHSGGPSERR